MSQPGREGPVSRYLHRPLWWAAGVGLFSLVLLSLDVVNIRTTEARLGETRRVTAQVAPTFTGGQPLDVDFTDNITGRAVRASIYVANEGLLPAPGMRVEIDASLADPRTAILAADRHALTDDFPLYATGVVVALAFWLTRSVHVRRTESLVATASTSYAMLAAVAPPGYLHRRWRLMLYALDSAPGAAPVCALTMLHVPAMASGVFGVEVKGAPRPLGRAAVRVGDEILWPRGRALPSASWPRPATDGALLPALPSALPAHNEKIPSAWTARVLMLVGVAALAAYFGFALADRRGLADTLSNSVASSGRVVETSTVGIAGSDVTVEYATPAGPRRGNVGVGNGPVGTAVPIRYDPAAPSVVWRAGGDPIGRDARATIGALLCVVTFTAAFMGAARARGRRSRELGAHELLSEARIRDGTPPMQNTGITCRDGALVLREADLSKWRTGELSRTTWAFDPEALLVTDHDGVTTSVPYDLVPLSASGRGADLIAFLASAPDARLGLAQPGRVIALIALLTCGAPAGTTESALYRVLCEPPGGL